MSAPDSYAALAQLAEELRLSRQDCAALRTALARVTEERDQWREQAQQAQHRQSQAVFRLHATIKELFA